MRLGVVQTVTCQGPAARGLWKSESANNQRSEQGAQMPASWRSLPPAISVVSSCWRDSAQLCCKSQRQSASVVKGILIIPLSLRREPAVSVACGAIGTAKTNRDRKKCNSPILQSRLRLQTVSGQASCKLPGLQHRDVSQTRNGGESARVVLAQRKLALFDGSDGQAV